jgi:hypothetical protein
MYKTKFSEKNMIKKIPSILFNVSIFTALLTASTFTLATPNSISFENVTEDVTYLAGDDLKGRGNFSSEIGQAAGYIAKRFKNIGLKNADYLSTQNYLQKYQVTKTSSEKLSVVINGHIIPLENLTVASTANNISWMMANGIKSNEFTIHNINEGDDFRAAINKLNQQGGEHLVLLHPSHKDMFKRYQHYFKQGITKLDQNKNKKVQGGTVVIALWETTDKAIETLSVSGVNSISNTELTNVIAILPGKTKPEEVVLYSAHYDHLGEKNAEGDSIYNGADDDASGTAAIINIAQYYAKQGNNARTLMFAAFSAEEIGGFGSKFFSQQLDPQTITAMINIEMIGKPSKFGAGTVWMTGMDRSNLGEQLNDVLGKSGKEIYKDPYPEQGLFYRSDNATLARLGVPAHSFSSTQLDKDEHYHQVSDDLSSLNLPSLHKVIEVLAVASQPLVNGTVTPSRIDVNKVKSKGLIF